MAFTPSILNVIGIGTARVFYAFEENSQRQDQQIDKNKHRFVSCEYRKACTFLKLNIIFADFFFLNVY